MHGARSSTAERRPVEAVTRVQLPSGTLRYYKLSQNCFFCHSGLDPESRNGLVDWIPAFPLRPPRANYEGQVAGMTRQGKIEF